MRFVSHVILIVLGNALGLWLAAHYVSGFLITSDLLALGKLALALAVLNFVLKPILKLVFGPIIILTLGLGLIAVNAVILYILDKYSAALTIETIPALIYGAVIVGFVNFIFHMATK